jgi:hypothetical protein
MVPFSLFSFLSTFSFSLFSFLLFCGLLLVYLGSGEIAVEI